MQKFNTQGIVLSRTNYGEAGRIITFLTPDHGKVKVMAKGVRKSKSKLAGGIELFSISDIGVMKGRGEIDTLVSSRLVNHFGNIVQDLDRTELAYQTIKLLDKATEDQPEPAYFSLLQAGFESLNDKKIELDLIEAWFSAQLLKLSGHRPNLENDNNDKKLLAAQKYDFNYDAMCFTIGKKYTSAEIKFLRLLFSSNPPGLLRKIDGSQRLSLALQPLLRSILQNYIRI